MANEGCFQEESRDGEPRSGAEGVEGCRQLWGEQGLKTQHSPCAWRHPAPTPQTASGGRASLHPAQPTRAWGPLTHKQVPHKSTGVDSRGRRLAALTSSQGISGDQSFNRAGPWGRKPGAGLGDRGPTR